MLKTIKKKQSFPVWLIKFTLVLLISGTFLYLFLKNVNFSGVFRDLSRINYYNFIWVILITITFLYARARRWKAIITPVRKISVTSAMANVTIGMMLNNVLPARAGELGRVMLLSKTEKISSASVLSALIIERLLDGYVLLFFLLISIYNVELIQSVDMMFSFHKAAVAVFIVYSLILAGMIFFVNDKTLHYLKKMDMKRFGFLVKKIEEFKSGMDIIRHHKQLFLICFWSIIIWAINAFIILAVFSMFLPIKPDIFDKIGLMESMFLLGTVSLGLVIPAVPGSFGTYHWIYKTVLMGIGMPESFCDTFVVFSHGSQYILITLIGMIFFLKMHLPFREYTRDR